MSDPIFLIGEAVEKTPRQIIPGKLYQSGAAEAMHICSNPGMVKELGLKAILTVAHDIRIQVPATLVHLHLPVDEINPTPEQYFQLACNLNVFPLLVHCMAGANRSRVFAAAIAWSTGYYSLENAIQEADPPPSGIVYESMVKWSKGIRR